MGDAIAVVILRAPRRRADALEERDRILGWRPGPKGKESSRRPSLEEEGKGKSCSSKEKGKAKKGIKEGKSTVRVKAKENGRRQLQRIFL